MRVRHTDLRTDEVIPELQRADRAVGRDDAAERDLQRGVQSTAVNRKDLRTYREFVVDAAVPHLQRFETRAHRQFF